MRPPTPVNSSTRSPGALEAVAGVSFGFGFGFGFGLGLGLGRYPLVAGRSGLLS